MGILFRKLAKHSRIPSLVPDGARTIFAGKNKRRPRHMFFSVNKGKRRRRIFLVIHVFPHENMVNPYSVILCRPSLCINIILPAIYDWLECLMTRNMSAVSALISPTRYHQLFFFSRFAFRLRKEICREILELLVDDHQQLKDSHFHVLLYYIVRSRIFRRMLNCFMTSRRSFVSRRVSQ